MTAQEILKKLKNTGITLPQIERMLDNRVSQRTLYRWLNGKAQPQRKHDLDALKGLLDHVC